MLVTQPNVIKTPHLYTGLEYVIYQGRLQQKVCGREGGLLQELQGFFLFVCFVFCFVFKL